MYNAVPFEPPYTEPAIRLTREYKHHFGAKAVRGLARMSSLMRNEIMAGLLVRRATRRDSTLTRRTNWMRMLRRTARTTAMSKMVPTKSTAATAATRRTTIRRSRTLSPPCSSATPQLPSEGYKLLEHCPALESDADLSNFVDKLVLVGHDSRQARGWFVGRVHSLVL